MAFKEVKQYFEQFGMGQKVLDLDKICLAFSMKNRRS